jgi:hypothetical protein
MMTHFRILTLLILFSTCVLSVSLTGRTLADTALPSPTGGPAISGVTYGRQQPVVGAKIYLLAANPAGYGNASLSLLTTAATGNAVDSVGAYATSGAVNDTFNIAGDYDCTQGYPLGATTSSGATTLTGDEQSISTCVAATQAPAPTTASACWQYSVRATGPQRLKPHACPALVFL